MPPALNSIVERAISMLTNLFRAPIRPYVSGMVERYTPVAAADIAVARVAELLFANITTETTMYKVEAFPTCWHYNPEKYYGKFGIAVRHVTDLPPAKLFDERTLALDFHDVISKLKYGWVGGAEAVQELKTLKGGEVSVKCMAYIKPDSTTYRLKSEEVLIRYLVSLMGLENVVSVFAPTSKTPAVCLLVHMLSIPRFKEKFGIILP